jgi:hypothetical protein
MCTKTETADLQAVLTAHAKWLSREGGERANLTNATMTGAKGYSR